MKLTVTPVLTQIENAFPSSTTVDVESLHFDTHDGLSVFVASREWAVEIHFSQTYGFRVLDELDLAELLPLGSLKNGWLYEVRDGGWKALEAIRPSFSSGRLSWVHEYLIVGRNECVSVLTKESFTLIKANQSEI